MLSPAVSVTETILPVEYVEELPLIVPPDIFKRLLPLRFIAAPDALEVVLPVIVPLWKLRVPLYTPIPPPP